MKTEMKVLHLGKFYPPSVGGMETFLADLLLEQVKMNNVLGALVHADKGERQRQKSEKEGITIYRAKTYGQFLYAPISPGYPLYLKKIIKTFDPDILHIHFPNFSPFWALFIPSALRIPWVVHWHSDVVLSKIDKRIQHAYKIYRLFEHRMLDKADVIIPTSKRYLDYSDTLKNYVNKCHVIPLGLDINKFNYQNKSNNREIWSEKTRKFRVLCVGRLTYYKGYEILLKALTTMENIDVCIVGEGERRCYLEQRIQNEKLNNKVRLLGGLTNEELAGAFESCDCLCLPSNERTEAFGLVLLEAMFFKKPVIVSDIEGSGVGWVVKDGITGLHFPPDDALQLSKTLKTLSRDKDLQTTLGKNGYNRLRKYFTIDKVASEIQNIYKNIE